MKKIGHICGCLLLTAILSLGTISTAHAAPAPGLSNFTRSRTYTAGYFIDVLEDQWFANNIKSAYEFNLTSGSGPNTFDPYADMTVGMAVALAARLHCIYNTGSADILVQGTPWYQVYVDYALANGIITDNQFNDYGAVATRAQCAVLLAAAIPAAELPVINTVEDGSIPDVSTDSPYYEDIYRLYRAGILTGNDSKGTFTPDASINRLSMLTIATRLVDTNLRKNVTLTKEYSGICGEGVYWRFEGGTLTIYGNGRMDGVSNPNAFHPWTTHTKNKVLPHLKKIVIEEGITSIGSFAFANHSNAVEVSIGNTVTEIGEGAFSGCIGLSSVTIPDSVVSFSPKHAFGYSAEGGVFGNCTRLTSVKLSNNLTEISEYAFAGCESLISISIPASVTEIGIAAFAGCSSLSSVTIPESVTKLGGEAFSRCTSLTTAPIPKGISSLSSSVFANCTGLTSVTIPDNITYLSGFNGCTNLTSVAIPDSVIEIGYNAFGDCTSLRSITLPDSVLRISNFAFDGCIGLSSIAIPSNTMEIRVGAFNNCSGLTSVIIPNHVTTIGDSAFNGCSMLRSVTIPNSVTVIGWHAFNNCTSLTSVIVPDSVAAIGQYAFSGCSNLSSVVVSNSISSIENCVFSKCTKLSSVFIPDSVTSIGSSAFEGCSSLTSIDLPDNVTTIGWGAFAGCTNLTTATIPYGLTTIGGNAFGFCPKLTIRYYSSPYMDEYVTANPDLRFKLIK